MLSPREQTPSGKLDIGVLYGFRALMVLLVANFHIWQQSWLTQSVWLFGSRLSFDFITRSGYMFVDGMILLSGFLLYLPYARQKFEDVPAPGVGRFYLNRLIRIVPSYTAAVLLALLFFAMPDGSYQTPGALLHDLFAHLTYTLTFWKKTYLFTPLNAALWTVAVEMQFYLIFPLLLRAARRRFALTLCLMAAAAFAYRAWVSYRVPETAMYINQLPAFMDVYALGMLGAVCYLRVRRVFAGLGARAKHAASLAALALFVGGLCAVLALLRAQSAASALGYAELRLSQMRLRLPLALSLLGCMLGAAFMPGALQWLFSNRLMRFLSAISFNLYMWHQILSARMKTGWFPDTLHSDGGLQAAFTLLSYSVAILVAMLATYGLEKPAAKLANNLINTFERKRDHERSPFGKTEPSADSLLMRAEKGRKNTD